MNFIVAANEKYMYPLKIMLTSLLDSNREEFHHIYFLYSNVLEKTIATLKKYLEKTFKCQFLPHHIVSEDFKDFPVSHHFSIETYYRFLAQDIIPSSEDRVLWLDADMIIRKPLKDFYYQDFEGNTLVACSSINKNPQELLDKLGCPEGTVYFNAGTILFNLKKLRNVTLRDYREFYEQNKDRITWLDQDILNSMYALNVKIADYRIYNMQMFSDPISEEEEKAITETSAILHYIGGTKPWHEHYANQLGKYWIETENKALTSMQRIKRSVRRIVRKVWRKVKGK